jgi:hypothetical protein
VWLLIAKNREHSRKKSCFTNRFAIFFEIGLENEALNDIFLDCQTIIYKEISFFARPTKMLILAYNIWTLKRNWKLLKRLKQR